MLSLSQEHTLFYGTTIKADQGFTEMHVQILALAEVCHCCRVRLEDQNPVMFPAVSNSYFAKPYLENVFLSHLTLASMLPVVQAGCQGMCCCLLCVGKLSIV